MTQWQGVNVMSLENTADERDWDSQREFKVLNAQEARQIRQTLKMVSPWRVVGAQAVAGVVCVAIAWVWSGQQSVAWSALYGALATVLPSALMARGMTRAATTAMSAALRFMVWEMLKIGVSIALLVIASRVVPQLSWPALLLTMVVCIKVNWIALLWRGR